jgi:WD40 repeat protein
VWDLSSGECIKTLYGHEYAINCLEITHDGKFLVSASMDKTIKIWNLQNYSCIKPIEGHVGPVVSMKITPDMKFIVSGGGGKYDNTVRIWDIYKSKLPSEEFGIHRNINHIAFNSTAYFVVNSCRKVIQLRDPETGSINFKLTGHKAHIKQLWVNPEGTRIISASLDKTVRIWDTKSKKCTAIIEEHTDGILDMCVSKDQKKLVSCGWDKQIIEWDIEKNRKIRTYNGHNLNVVHTAYFSLDKRLISISSDDIIKIWDTTTGICLNTIQCPLNITTGITLDSKDNLYLGYMDGSIQYHDLQNGELLRLFSGHTALISCLELVEEENMLLSGSKDNTIRQWDLTSGECIKVFTGHQGEVVFIRKIPSQKKIISASRDHTLRVWDLHSGQCISVLTTNLLINFLTTVDENSRFAYGTLQGEFKIVDLK